VEFGDGSAHGEAGGLEDVDAVDFVGIGCGYGVADGSLADALGEDFAALWVDLLAVVEASDGASGVENDRGGVDGAEEGASADFVYSGDVLEAAGSGGAF